MIDYRRVLQGSVNFVEQKLYDNIQLEEVAERAGLSLYHFMRVFMMFTGYSLKGYIRARRLSEAAKKLLKSDEYIYNIGCQYGFGTVEAFIRAFKKQYGLTPQEYRKRNQLIDYIPKMRVQICLQKPGGNMVKYQIREMPELTVIGRKQKVISSETTETLNRLLREFRADNARKCWTYEKTVVGICFHDPRFFDKQPEPDDDWWYMVGYLGQADEPVPEELERYQVKAQRYAVFTHPGNLSNLGKTYRYICLDWIREVDYEFYPGDELNFYSERYDAENAENSEYDLYIPICR